MIRVLRLVFRLCFLIVADEAIGDCVVEQWILD